MSFDVDTGVASDRGPRALNEDFAAVRRADAGDEARGLIAAVADGVSAGGQGRMAAQTSVLSLVDDYFGAPDTWDTTVVLDRVVSAHNTWLVSHNRRASTAAMTTLTAVVLRGRTWTLAHVGDTRAYLLRGGESRRLTQDHAFDHPDLKSRLTRAVGLDDAVHVDYLQGDLQPGDAFLIVSDGVHAVLREPRLVALAAVGSAQQAAEAIVQAALAAGSVDNATALLLRVGGLTRLQLADTTALARRLPIPRRLNVGDGVDGLVVTARVADNGVHVLYQVREPSSGALRALKTLHPSRAGDPQERAMLAHEAWLAARVTEQADDGFVRLLRQTGATEFYLLYDWHSGQTLDRTLAERGARGLPVASVIEWGLAAASALGRLHRLGVVHRDVKPANLHLGDDGTLRLLDLGVALSGSEPVEQRDLHAGTPSYMSPELWENAPASRQSDLFALGVTLYQLATGLLPYGEIEPYQSQRYRRDPKAPSRLRPDVPIWLDHIVLKAVARDPAQRFETAEELVLALQRGASRPLALPPPSPLAVRDPLALWKIACGVSLLLNALLVYWLLFLPR
jgi:serine/threonine protein phosphatase PrpC